MAVSRQVLFAEVWAEPMTTVAAGHGVSSHFLACVCDAVSASRGP